MSRDLKEGYDEFGNSLAIDMILFCPNCGLQHVDKAEVDGWQNPPHRSHLCHGCMFVWRPADAYTNGVAEITTHGKNDSPIHRGRAKAVSMETIRVVNIINAADWAGPRLTAIKADLIRNIRQR